jgi:hypothetical protein
VLDSSAIAQLVAALRGIEDEALALPIDAWVEDAGLVVASDELHGQPLRRVALEDGVGGAVDVVRAVARALVPAHRAGIVHGALCPEVLRIGAGGTVHVGGIGIPALIGPTSLLRIAGANAGRYLSPEQVREQPAREASDVHALGAILHELLSGRPAYDGATAPAVFASIATDDPPRLPASLPEALRAVITKALAKDPAARIPDAQALVRALDPFGSRLGTTTPRPVRAQAPADDEIVWGAAGDAPSGRRSEVRDRSAGPGKVARFTGALAQQHLTYARKRWGEEKVARALAAIERADRDEVSSATAVSWVRVEAFERFHVALARELGRRVEESHPEIVVEASRRTFSTLWRMLLRVGGARLVMTRAPVVYSKTYDTGAMETRDVGDDGGRFVLSGWPDVPEFVLRGLRAGMAAGLESVGRSGVVLTSTRTADGATFVARWDR